MKLKFRLVDGSGQTDTGVQYIQFDNGKKRRASGPEITLWWMYVENQAEIIKKENIIKTKDETIRSLSKEIEKLKRRIYPDS